jgi:hypothetical protein
MGTLKPLSVESRSGTDGGGWEGKGGQCEGYFTQGGDRGHSNTDPLDRNEWMAGALGKFRVSEGWATDCKIDFHFTRKVEG